MTALTGLLAAVVVAASGYGDAAELCSLQDGRIREASGLAVVGDRLFTHNDSGDAGRFFELDAGCRTVAVHDVDAVSPVDWEDLAPGPSRTLWFADIGDNDRQRATVAVHRVPVPTSGSAVLSAVAYRLRYADGPHDAEALLVHPRTGELAVVTRDKAGAAAAYVPDGRLAPGRTTVLRKATDVAPLGLGGLGGVTGGAVSPTGDRVALRTLTTLYEWDVGPDGVAASLANEPRATRLPLQRQGESVAYTSDGQALLVGTEGEDAPLHVLRREATPRSSRPTGTPAAPPPPASALERNRPSYPTWLPVAVAGAAVTVAAAVLARRRRRGG